MTQLSTPFDALVDVPVTPASAFVSTNGLEPQAISATSVSGPVHASNERNELAPNSQGIDTLRAADVAQDQSAHQPLPNPVNQPASAPTLASADSRAETATNVVSVGTQVSAEEMGHQAVDVYAVAANGAVQALINIASSTTQALLALANQIPPGLQAHPSLAAQAPAPAIPGFHRFSSALPPSDDDEYQPSESIHSSVSSGLSSIHGYVDADRYFVEGSPLPLSPSPLPSSPLPPSSESPTPPPTPVLGSPFATPPAPAPAGTITGAEASRHEALCHAAVLRLFSRRYAHMSVAYSAAAVGAANGVLSSIAHANSLGNPGAGLGHRAAVNHVLARRFAHMSASHSAASAAAAKAGTTTNATPANGTANATPANGTTNATPVNGTVNGASANGANSAAPIHYYYISSDEEEEETPRVADPAHHNAQPVASMPHCAGAGQPAANSSHDGSAGWPLAGPSRITGGTRSSAVAIACPKKRPNLRGSDGGPFKKPKHHDESAN